MKLSKYINIDPNILIEYLYDDGNLIGESYGILQSTKTGLRSFISFTGSETNNDIDNQLYSIDTDRYSKILISDNSFIQKKDYPSSIPIRYDSIKVHIPVDYTFGDNKGFYLRVYTYDYSNKTVVEMSNYYFNITDIEQNYKMMYSSPTLLINEKNWGKFLRIDIPSVTKISDQRKNDITKENTINWNLTNGIGLSKNAPVFIDFHYIENIDLINGSQIMNLGSRITLSVPQTPDFENLGVMIEKSNQGDFMIVYPVYNGSQGEFGIFLNESYYMGNRYYLEYQIDLFEKNILTKTQTFVVNENFTEEIEYRPIIKYSTTTAAIDVTLKMIDSVDGSYIIRKASYGMIQNEVSLFSKNLTKLDLTKAKKPQVFNIKDIISPNTSDNPFGTKPILILDKIGFNLYSQSFNIINQKSSVSYEKKSWKGISQILVNIFPFDNILKFTIIKPGSLEGYSLYNLTDLNNLCLTIKSDKKIFNFPIYKDSSDNDLENGSVVFKIPEGKYQELKSIHLIDNSNFYINGIDEFQNKVVIYNSSFIPFDSMINIQKMESLFKSIKPSVQESNKNNKDDKKAKEVKAIEDKKQSGVNSEKIKKPLPINNSAWKIPNETIIYSYGKNNYEYPNDINSFKINLANKGILEKQGGLKIATNDIKVQLILGYFKGLDLSPSDVSLDFIFKDPSPQRSDIFKYIESGISTQDKSTIGIARSEKEVLKGEFLPDRKDYEYIISSISGNKKSGSSR